MLVMGGDTSAAFLLPKKLPYTLSGKCVMQGATQVKCHPTRARALRHLAALMANVPDAKAVADTGGGGRKPMTRSEAARHASLVRWKKEQPLAANVQQRLAEIRAARLKKKAGGKGKAKGKAKAGGKGKAAAKPKQASKQPKQTQAPKQPAAGGVAKPKPAPAPAPQAKPAPKATVKPAPAPKKKVAAKPKAKAAPKAKRATPEANRKQVTDKMMQNDEGITAAGRDALQRLADGGEMDKVTVDAQEAMGLVERDSDGNPRATTHGRALLRAIDKGDYGAALDAIGRAKDKAKAKSEKKRAREGERQMLYALGAAKGTTMTDYAPVLDDLRALRNELHDMANEDEDDATKAGRRNAAGDQSRIDQIYELAMELCDIAEALGADTGEEEGEEEVEGGEVEMVEGKAAEGDGDEFAVVVGAEVKSIGGDQVRGLAIRFGNPDEPDMSHMRDFFSGDTAYWLDAWKTRPMLYHHAMEENTADDPIVGTWTKATVTDEGVWLEGELSKSFKYRAAIKEMVRRGLLHISTDSAPHLVKRERLENGTNAVKRWPICAASLTISPAEPRLASVAFKSLIDELGLPLEENGETELKAAIELELIEIEAEYAAIASMAG